MLKRTLAILFVGLSVCAPGLRAAPPAIDAFIEEGGVGDIKISPTGEYLAMSVRKDGQTGIAVLARADNRVLSAMRFGRDTHVHDFWWVNGERLLMSMAETFGTRDDPVPTGELYGMNADGGRRELLVGYRAVGQQTGSRIGVKKDGNLIAYLVDPLPEDDKHVLVSVHPFGKDPFASVHRMNVYDGRRVRVAWADLVRGDFLTDGQGRVRFAFGSQADNYSQLLRRPEDGAPWESINHERVSDRVETPLGFAADDVTAYLRVSRPAGPDRIVAMDTRTGERRDVAHGEVDPRPVYLDGWKLPVGAWYHGPSPKLAFFDEASDEARLQQALQRSFPDAMASVRSGSRDGRYRVVLVESDVDPGSFYLFDTQDMRASMILARDEQIDPRRMSPMRPIRLQARDGLELHGS